jgi:tetratricopeptide (TPR) repeat protein
MSEETRSAEETGTPVAVSLGLAGASREEADAFLRDQRHHMHEQLKEISLRLWELRLGVLLRIATAFVGVAVAAALAFMIWNAARSNDLVIDAFAVPPELAAHGLSGPVVAAKLSDKIAVMQAETQSDRPAKSYAGLSEGLKLEIPETGVSLSELDRFLRQQLGHDLHIGGEMVQTDQGVAFTARVGSDGSATVTGNGADTDTLLQKLAEQVYRITQPYRYGVWLQGHGRTDEALEAFRKTATSGPAREREWAYNGWANISAQSESASAALALWHKSLALNPDFYFPALNAAQIDNRLGRMQDSRRGEELALAALLAHGRDYALPQRISVVEHNIRSGLFSNQGALLEATQQDRQSIAEGAPLRNPALAEHLAALHEPTNARMALTQAPAAPAFGASQGAAAVASLNAREAVALESQNWPQVLSADRALAPLLARYPGFGSIRATFSDPTVALALAHTRQFAAAEARLKPMPADCYRCLIARAQVAELERQPARADFWFARAVHDAPYIPFAYEDWGRALLDRGKPDDAIAQFKLANRRGPHFADPLEGWGEALMAKNQSHLALAKFAEAQKYAPNWGRLHLKWGEALVYAGKPAEAKAQFARAAALDLTPSEKSELARHP